MQEQFGNNKRGKQSQPDTNFDHGRTNVTANTLTVVDDEGEVGASVLQCCGLLDESAHASLGHSQTARLHVDIA